MLLNPANSGVTLPPMPQGGLSGFLSGMQVGTADQMNQHMLRDDDLEYAINQIRQQSDQSKLGVQQAQDQNALSAAGITAGQYANGQQQQLADSNMQEALAGSQQKTIASQDAIKAAVAPVVVRMGEYIKAKGGKLDPNNQGDLDAYNEFRTVMTNHGVKVPSFPDPGDTVGMLKAADNASQYVSNSAQSYINTAPYQQEMGAIGAKTEGQKQVAEIQAAAHTEGATIEGKYHLAAANSTANAGIQRSEILAASARNASQSLDAFLSVIRRSGGFKPEDVGQARQLAFEKIWNGPQFNTFASINFQAADPGTQARIKQAMNNATAQAEYILNKEPAFVRAAAIADDNTKKGLPANNGSTLSNGTTPATPAAPVAPVQTQPGAGGAKAPVTIKGDDDYNSLPSGTRFSGPGDPPGTFRVKP